MVFFFNVFDCFRIDDCEKFVVDCVVVEDLVEVFCNDDVDVV